MIVKNEAKVILRLLQSVAPWVDDYVICDTGSTDNTPQLITEFFEQKHIPGLIFHEPFIHFEHNRNVALRRAVEVSRSNYLLLVDADMELIVRPNCSILRELGDHDYYQLVQGSNSFRYLNTRIIRRDAGFTYHGVTHEYMDVPTGASLGYIHSKDVFVHDIGDGGSKGNKLQRDIRLLEEGLEREPDNVRYHFYLANTYREAGKMEQAIAMYKRRIQLGGWEEEIFMSYYSLGKCYSHMGREDEAVAAWLNAYQAHPRRLESLYELTRHYRCRSKHHLAAMCYEQARRSQQSHSCNPEQFLFAELDVYRYLFDVERLISGYYIGGGENVDQLLINILTHGHAHDIANALSNAKFYKYVPPGQITSIDFQTSGGLRSSSISFIPHQGGFLCNQRTVNYHITPDGSYQDLTQPDNVLRQVVTQNWRVLLSSSFEVLHREQLSTDLQDETLYYVGIEDIKLFRHGENVHFIGTQYDAHKRRLGIATGTYEEKILCPRQVVPFWNPEFTCEKNWVFVEVAGALKIIYKWHPLWVLNLNGEKEREIDTPTFLQHARGSTCGAQHGNEWYFVVHFVSHESPRHYYHMVIVLNQALHLVRHSRFFSFEGAPIEFCLGLLVDDTSCVFGYSTWDRTSRIKRVSKNHLFC